jgi:hypothetical protein
MPQKQKIGVSAQAMALHLGMARPSLDVLVADRIIEKLPNGRYDIDKTRVAYITHLRRARRTSPQTTARAEFDAAKARDLQVRAAIREGTLMETEEAIAIVDELVGFMLAGLSGLPARITRNMEARREIEAEIFNLRQALADKRAKRAAELETAANTELKANAGFVAATNRTGGDGASDRSAAIERIEDFARLARDELSALPAKMSGGDAETRARMVHEVRRVADKVDRLLQAKLRELRGECGQRLEAAIANLVRIVTDVLISRLRESMLREIDTGTAH